MDKNLHAVVDKRIEGVVKALRGNQMEAHYIPTKDDLLAKLDELMPKGCSCSVGGSVTLGETGVLDYLKSGDFEYYDRYAPDADVAEVFHKALSCDVYLTSTNALTEKGELLNIDGRGNRVAAMAYGPAKVIVITGYNKIVRDLAEARDRVRTTAGPANTMRLGYQTPCAKTGTCMDCHTPARICSHELISGYQHIKDRICVLILGEEYGY